MTKTPQYVLHNQENKDSRKGTHQQAQKVGNSTKEKKSLVCTSSNSRHFIKPLSHSLFPLEVLLVSIRKGFLCFLYLSSADLIAFLAVALEAVATSQAFLEALSSASRDEMRALAVAKASAVQQRGKRG
jgi:hypothetical protein